MQGNQRSVVPLITACQWYVFRTRLIWPTSSHSVYYSFCNCPIYTKVFIMMSFLQVFRRKRPVSPTGALCPAHVFISWSSQQYLVLSANCEARTVAPGSFCFLRYVQLFPLASCSRTPSVCMSLLVVWVATPEELHVS